MTPRPEGGEVNCLEVLAEYLTGENTKPHSIGLQMPKTTPQYKQAKRYFELREAFGVKGYAAPHEALAEITHKIRILS